MLKLLLVTLLSAALVQCCEKQSFQNVKIKASKYFSSKNESNDIQLETLTGCIEPNEELKNALSITIENQQVPVLYSGSVQDMPWLHELILNANNIEKIEPGAFLNLKTMATISLERNKITTIPEGVFNGMEIKRLLLSDNLISKIDPGAFDNMPELNRIDLDNNKLQVWNADWFKNTPNIILLSVRNNQIKELPADAFKNIKGSDKPFKTKTTIFLGGNEIEAIDKNAFRGIKDLQMLDLDKNHIATIDANVFSGMKTIKTLLLAGNKIKCLSDSILDSLPVTEMTNLENNPLDCVCLKSMQNWSKKHNGNLKTYIRKIECMQERIKNVLDSVKQPKFE
ncbi:leucine-rich repeat-containing protein let-4-like [Photinus pyralis]|uniref:LRRCT domain-containing protein n=1 Tax=Photinus pyralis TaxID=7054 RepID=A0A1Y1LVQ6_PHOPY|nr:leucine-rich repeat-containing protein let-4-like [Photinus pyralis]